MGDPTPTPVELQDPLSAEPPGCLRVLSPPGIAIDGAEVLPGASAWWRNVKDDPSASCAGYASVRVPKFSQEPT